MKRPLVLVAAAFALGDALGNQINHDPRIALITLASLFICAFLCYRRFWVGTGVVILTLFLMAGFLWNGLARQKIEAEGQAWPSGPVVFTGTVVADPTGYPDRTAYILGRLRLTGDTGSRSLKGRAQLVIYAPQPQTRYHYGDRLQVRGKMELPSVRRNPGEFDYREYLARHGVYGRVSAFRPADVTLVGQETGNPLIGISLAAKGRVVSLVDSVLPPRQAGVMLALLLGDRERLDGQQVDLYRTLGVMHIFSVSGLHVGFVLFFLLVLGRLLRLSARVGTLAAVIVLVFYSAMVGFPSSVVRAMVMAIMVLGARLVMREPDFYTGLAAAALVILLWNPLQLNDPGFQLSFMATWGLVYLEPIIAGWLSFLPGWRRVLVAPITAQLGVLPLTALYFNTISLLAIPANILVVGLAGVITVLGLVMFVLALTFAPVGEMIALAVGGLVFMMEKMLNMIGQIPWSAFTVSSPAWFTIGTYYLVMIAFREYWLHRAQPRWAVAINRWRKEVVLGLLAVVLLMFMLSGSGNSDRLQVVFLDVGEGDAIFIQTPGNYTALVDGGGKAGAGGDQGGRVILPYLHRMGIRKLDLVASSHPDSDHLLGLFSVVKEIAVARVILPPVPEPPGDYA
ncbi:MAG: ComEC/Rec2 family competence protein, partial [Bacillota bacterium]